MRIIWDFRLFSYAYRNRGVGAFCRAMAKSIIDANESGEAGASTNRHCEIYVWGNRDHVPAELAECAARWIPYDKGSWKSDLLTIPFLIVRHRIQVFHYWVAMGPVFRIGMGLFHPCATCMTVHDLGVEHVHDRDFLDHVRDTHYWRFQKKLLGTAGAIVCNSLKTREEVIALAEEKRQRCEVIYMPAASHLSQAKPVESVRKRMRMFVTLGGAPHKNVRTVIEAFSLFSKSHPGFCLVVLGNDDKAKAAQTREAPAEPAADTVFFEGMDRYEHYLDNAVGLVACSTYEGLGIPPLEAMAHGCPIVASDMAVFHETCEGAARFVNPGDAASIVEGMADVADRQEEWAKKSVQGFERYAQKSEHAGTQWVDLYRSLCPGRRGKS
jgi:glycosyltransferase involved in cell wall biosynthesis